MLKAVPSPRLGEAPREKANSLLCPIVMFSIWMTLSFVVAFQNPPGVRRFGLDPFGYFLSLGVKKYHSSSPLPAALWLSGES